MNGVIRYIRKYKNVFIILSVAIVTIIVFLFFNSSKNTEGINYIEDLESQDVSKIAEELSTKRKSERKKALEEGKIDVFGLFDDYVFLGDSRVMGFTTYNFLNSSRIMAVSGASIYNVDDFLSQIGEIQPANIYLSYGVNDMGLNLDDTSAGTYGQLYEQQVKKILNICPKAHIYVNSIIPATPKAVQDNSPNWGKVNIYNNQLKEICKNNGWIYIDNDGLADGGNAAIYQDDGIHFLSSFYSTWAQNIINATVD